MSKMKIWKIGCAIFMFLIICTGLSYQIERLMWIEVSTVAGEPINEEVAYPVKLESSLVYYIEEEETRFGKEWVVKTKEVNYFREENGKTMFPSAIMKDDLGRYIKVITKSSHPVEAGEIVKRKEIKDEGESNYRLLLAILGVSIPFSIWIILFCLRKMGDIPLRKWRSGLAGVLVFLVWCGIYFAALNHLQIPREKLPKDNIFDLSFYIESIS